MKIYAAVCSILLQVLLIADASAAAVELVGAKVTFRFDSENTGLFNTWELATDAQQQDLVRFVPTGFKAESPVQDESGAIGLRSKSQELVMTITANPGYQLGGAALLQKGIYTRWGASEEFLAATAVSVTGAFTVGSDVASIATDNALNDGNIGTDLPLASIWSLSRSTDSGNASSFIVKVSSSLFAFSGFPSGQALASIQNDLTQVTAHAEAVAVPLPASFPLLGTALLAVFLIAPSNATRRTNMRR